MKFILFITFLTSLAKAGLLIGLGILLKNHFETVLSTLIRKPIPEDLIERYSYEKMKEVIRWIGIFVMILGIGMAVIGLSTLIMGFQMPMNNFNFNF
ncbi:hypothetical protein [Carboxylicivirga caseinilyticus]|uniref:hypothetical protein n=1 Tax=Carboxylicivirga caseinilyticus TaxID=3417572 RepID=UPI003D3315B3|nr:hypothetical protein [Marinilabiliaceae bacterium A049]